MALAMTAPRALGVRAGFQHAPKHCSLRHLRRNSTGKTRAGRRRLQQLSKLVDAQTCVPNDATHREGIDGIAARDGDDSNTVRHDDVLALADNAEAGFLQSLHGLKVGDPGQLPHS